MRTTGSEGGKEEHRLLVKQGHRWVMGIDTHFSSQPAIERKPAAQKEEMGTDF